jgi:hypothetical protein
MLRRKALSVIDGNRRKGHELDPNLRGEITGAAEAGLSNGVVGKLFEIDRETVRKKGQLQTVRQQGHSLPRTGRPKKATAQDIHAIVRYVRAFPKNTYAKMRQELQILLSTSTIKRILVPFHIRK